MKKQRLEKLQACPDFEGWKKRFMPIDADDVDPNDTIAQLRHALRKWTGMQAKYLKKYGLTERVGDIYSAIDGLVLRVNASTCALCLARTVNGTLSCETCPLTQVLGDACDQDVNREPGPYGEWAISGDPSFMLKTLRTALRRELAKAARTKKGRSRGR